MLWSAVKLSRYKELPAIRYTLFDGIFRILNLPFLSKAFSVTDDVRPPHTKSFHPFGTVAKVEYIPAGDHPFTGLFQSGFKGVMRLSIAMDYARYGPSTALKALVDGQPSRSILMDQSLDPQSSRDFFERPPTNITIVPSSFPIGTFWWLVNWWLFFIADPLYQPLNHLAEVTRTGEAVKSPRSPHQIQLYAPPEVHMFPDTKEDFRTALGQIPQGTLLFSVYAKANKEDNKQFLIGHIRTDSEFIASDFGDRVLSIRHNRKDKPSGKK